MEFTEARNRTHKIEEQDVSSNPSLHNDRIDKENKGYQFTLVSQIFSILVLICC